MFKRVVKRVKRQEKEAEMGITPEMKEVMGMQDTDSDESQDSDSEEEITVTNFKSSVSRKRKRDDEDGSSPEQSSNEAGKEENDISVQDVLSNPVRDMSCIICPGKTIKHDRMEQVHLDSAHHKRRMKRFQELVARLSTKFEDVHSDSAIMIVQIMNDESPAKALRESDGLSNQAKKTEKLKEKRKKKKENRKAEKANVQTKGSTKPLKKKRKSQKEQV